MCHGAKVYLGAFSNPTGKPLYVWQFTNDPDTSAIADEVVRRGGRPIRSLDDIPRSSYRETGFNLVFIAHGGKAGEGDMK